jgi:hypothetical protein
MNYDFETELKMLILDSELKWLRTGDEGFLDQLQAYKRVNYLYKKYQ